MLIPSITDLDLVARTLMAEAEGEIFEGKVAVAAVIYNRARMPGWWGKTIKGVCLAPKQFSSWNDGNPRRKLLGGWELDDEIFCECWLAALEAIHRDPTDGCDSFYAHAQVFPNWARGRPGQIIGNHTFLKTRD